MRYPLYLCDESGEFRAPVCSGQYQHLIRRKMFYDMVFAENRDKTRNLDFKRFYGPIFRCLQLVLPDIRAGTPHNNFVSHAEPMHEYLSGSVLEGTAVVDPGDVSKAYVTGKSERDLKTCAMLALDRLSDSDGRRLMLCAEIAAHSGGDKELVPVRRLRDMMYKDVKMLFGVLPALRADVLQFISAKVGVLSVSETRELVYGIFALYAAMLPFNVGSNGLSADDCRRVLVYSVLKNGYSITLEQENCGFRLKPVMNNFKNIVLVTGQQDEIESLAESRYSLRSAERGPPSGIRVMSCRVDGNDFKIVITTPTASRDMLYSAMLLSNQDYFLMTDATGLDDYRLSVVRRTVDEVLRLCSASKDKTPVYSAQITGTAEDVLDRSVEMLKHNAVMDMHKLMEVSEWISSQTSENMSKVFSDLSGVSDSV